MKKICLKDLQKVAPKKITKDMDVIELIENSFTAYNSARLKEACHVFAEKMLTEDSIIGISLAGALTPAGFGKSCIVPLIEHGFIDWISSTGANLYHDTHFGIGEKLYKGSPFVNDVELKKSNVVRIYDVLFDFQVLVNTDKFYYKILLEEEFQKEMSSSELHHLVGKYVLEREKALEIEGASILGCANKYDVPVYVPSPGDSTIGLNIARHRLQDNVDLKINPSRDINETTGIVLEAKRNKMKTGLVMLGGGAPKNFMLQTEPYLQEILGIIEYGHDYFIQVTDARPDTGGLSGATPSEAVSWGKVNPDELPNSIVVYTDSTIALPLITHYVLKKCKKREPKRLFKRRDQMVEELRKESVKTFDKMIDC